MFDAKSLSREELLAEAKRLNLQLPNNAKNTALIAAIEEVHKANLEAQNAADAVDQAATANEPAVEPSAPETETETEAAKSQDDPAEPSADVEPSPEVQPPDPDASHEAPIESEPAELEQPIVKSNFLKVQIRDFRGSFLDAKFDDNGVCERISEQTLRTLASEFPGIDVVDYQEL